MSEVLKGALRSKTVWLGVLTAVLPQLQSVATVIHPAAGAVLGALIIVLRSVTDTSLADKGAA